MAKKDTSRLTAKDRCKIKLLEYLGDPNNKYLNRAKMCTEILGYKNRRQINQIFTSAEIHAIEREALEIRRKKYSPKISEIDAALISQAKSGDVAACKLAYQRFEGWSEKTINENTGKDGEPLYPEKITINLVSAAKSDTGKNREEISVLADSG